MENLARDLKSVYSIVRVFFEQLFIILTMSVYAYTRWSDMQFHSSFKNICLKQFLVLTDKKIIKIQSAFIMIPWFRVFFFIQ